MEQLFYTYTGAYELQEGEHFCTMQKFSELGVLEQFTGIQTINVIKAENVKLIGNATQYREWLNEFYVDTNLSLENP